MRIILVNPKKRVTIKEITEEYFDTKVYNNEGIQDPNIVGFMRYGINKDSGEFYQIFVHPDHRKEGIGTLLIEELIAITKKNKKNKIIVHTGTDETDIFGAFITRKGFKNLGNKWWELLI